MFGGGLPSPLRGPTAPRKVIFGQKINLPLIDFIKTDAYAAAVNLVIVHGLRLRDY